MKIFTTDKLLSLAFGTIIFLFFAFAYPFHLNYQEQYQLFLFSTDYFFQLMGKPGGFSDYIGKFFTQFFFYSWIGAIIIAVMLTLFQQLLWFIAKKLGSKPIFVPLTFIPSLLYWGLLCDENYLLGGLISMLIVSFFIVFYMLLKSGNARVPFVLISIPLLYWLAGGVFLLLPLFAVARELMSREMKKIHLVAFILACVVLSPVLPVIIKEFFLQYPMKRLWIGVDYFRFPESIPTAFALIGMLIIIIPFLLSFLTKLVKTNRTVIFLVIQLGLITFGAYHIIYRVADMTKEEVMAYDFNVRMRKWDKVIALADKKSPSSPLSVTCLNLALAKQNLLGERMFHYYQNGIQGLLPDFKRDFTIPMIAGEVYYHLGFVNTAQRYAFEAMEALPDYQKSARAVKRLAETNLINGEYKVAEKYLRLLQKTFYYRTWANRTIEKMKDEKLINQHSEWGWLRQCRPDKDFLFSEKERNMMLGVLFTHNNKNRMAYEYLLAYCALTKDLQHFIQYFPLGKSLAYNKIPKSYQEALIYIWGLTNKDPIKNIPYSISDKVKNQVQKYMKIYTSKTNVEPLLQEGFSDTYWYYLHFRK